MFSFQVNGLGTLTRNIQDLCDDIRNDATRQGLHASANVIEEAYRGNLHYGTQPKLKPRMKDVVAHKIWKYPDGTGMAAIIGTISGMAPHAHLVEDGTKERLRSKYGIGGHFRFMMKDVYHNPHAVSRNPYLGKRLRGIGKWDGHLLSPGDPLTKTGAMAAQHPLARAVQQSEASAVEAFITNFNRIIDKPVVIN